MKHIKDWLRYITLLISELPIQIIGLLVNALAIPFAKKDTDTSNAGESKPYTQYPEHGNWTRYRLPKIFLWFDNPYDGLTGDKRGWWANECRVSGRTEYDFLSMYIWSAIRNPANYFSRKVTGCDVSDCTIEMLCGNTTDVDDSGKSGTSWNYLVATDSLGKRYVRAYGFIKITSTRGILFNFGWKIKLSHIGTPREAREQDRFKGNTIRFNPFAKINQS